VCATYDKSECNTKGAYTCTSGISIPAGPVSTITGSVSVGNTIGGTQRDNSQRTLEGALSASVLIAFFWTLFVFFYAYRCAYPLVLPAPYHPLYDARMEKWRRRAMYSTTPQFAGYFFLTMGIAAAVAAFALPWCACGLGRGGTSPLPCAPACLNHTPPPSPPPTSFLQGTLLGQPA